MPEGPEVKTVSDKLSPFLTNKIITGSSLGPRAKTIGFSNLKCPSTIISVRSYGKKIIIDLNTSYSIIISLGMTGRLQFTSGNHSHVKFDISDYHIKGSLKIMNYQYSLFFDDHRYMGSVDIIPSTGFPLYFKDIGPDILQASLHPSTWIPLDTWISIFTQKKLLNRPICNVLVDQSLVSGLGWYLQTEILYYSGIHPERTVKSLSHSDLDTIRICSHKIILLSYSYGGFTIKDFISPDGQKGIYPAVVYGKSFDPLGNQVVNKKIKDRTLHFVPVIQQI
jgi:formamidopyrimidine-DNA glycosylase